MTSTLINFNELASASDQMIAAYHNSGYTFDTNVDQPTKFTVFGTSNTGRYAGSPALFSEWSPSTISLSRDDGAAFTLNSMSLSTFWSSIYNVTVSFTGTKADGTKVAQSFPIGSRLGFHTATFLGFNNLKSVTWASTTVNDYHEFDDVSVQTSGPADLTGVNFGSLRQPPVAVADAYAVTKSTPLVVAAASGVLANDTDPAGLPLAATLWGNPAHGSVALAADGSFTYTPGAGHLGADSFTYKANDGTLDSNIATATIAVTPNLVAADHKYDAPTGSPLSLAAPGVLAGEIAPAGDTVTAALVAAPAHGVLALNADGSFTYTPAVGFNGLDLFTYRLNDGPNVSNTATVTVTVPTPPRGGSAGFVGTDAATRGDWRSVYGADGYAMAGRAASPPPYAAAGLVGQSDWTWADPTADARALADPAGPGRLAATWYSPSSFAVDLNLTDGRAHIVSAYLLDWDGGGGRAERVDVLDAATGAVLDTRDASSFAGGEYLTWSLAGHVQLRFTDLRGDNAVLGGLFFG